MKNVLMFSLLLILMSCEKKGPSSVLVANSSSETSLAFNLIPIIENTVSPVDLVHAGDERLFIVGQPGIVTIIKNGKSMKEPFLDITSMVDRGRGYSEKGLLGMAFHPQYKSNGRFFLYYSSPSQAKGSDHKTILAEFNVSENQDIAAAKSIILLEIEQPESNHNGGQLAFGPDGYLYIGTGDGGGAGDSHGEIGNGQNLKNLLGKILRIDVNSGSPYGIPEDNPFAKDFRAKPEIWAYGLRNPWRFSFDKKTGILYCGDVGQNSFEEIDIIEKGKNYGWRAMEGNKIYDENLIEEEMTAPIHEYPRNVGVSVIGGYVYRGKESPAWNGKYFFADWNGKLFYLEQNESGQWLRNPISFGLGSGFTINAFGEDSQGELYVIGQNEVGSDNKSGVVYRLSAAQ